MTHPEPGKPTSPFVYAEVTGAFNPATTEAGLYDHWDAAGYFAPSEHPEATPFVIVMPPPNLTGELHVGHALFVALQDLMIRWRRMHGDAALWIPGADHAGIAGQWVVERQLAEEGLTRHDLGREAFLERVWQYMDQVRPRIREQMQILGASCDWDRFTFTMDSGPSQAVRTVFKHLYDKGLIYRGRRLISWCPRCQTALSDLEVDYQDVDGQLWHLIYPLEDDRSTTVTVATTRPETMLGDTAVAVHPEDRRYQALIGRSLMLPILGRSIPIIVDDSVDMSFGSGAVKVTPAHDPNDFEIGSRHDLPMITVMGTDGTMNMEAGPFEGETIRDARDHVVARLKQDGALLRVDAHSHSVGHCERCGTVVEPLISEQWFVKMEPLAAPATVAAHSGEVSFVPERFQGVYLNWMENIHDWCISRQLWWGHRIPVWYCQACDASIVTEDETLAKCPYCGGTVEQDPDVLDTWFSSGLWPFSTLGWPDENEDLRRFYPSAIMETGYEILFFWVARMVFFGYEMMGEAPFHTVYLHGTVRDGEGAKMSKTKGNVLDPTDITAEYGADALRFALVTQGSPGVDMRLSMAQVESSRNFINKLWNVTKFGLRAFEQSSVMLDGSAPARPIGDLLLPDRWILSRTDRITREVNRLLDSHLYGEAGRQLREFAWSELADWYVEAAKVRLRADPDERQQVAQVLAYVLERVMRLLHPFMPFVTETMWQALPHRGDSLMISSWPTEYQVDAEAEETWQAITDLVVRIRHARSEAGVEAGNWIAASIHSSVHSDALESVRREVIALGRIDEDQLEITSAEPAASDADIVVVSNDIVAVLPMEGMVDLDAEIGRLRSELDDATAERKRAQTQLGNSSFVERAPEHVVDVQRRRLAEAEERIAVLSRRLAEIEAAD